MLSIEGACQHYRAREEQGTYEPRRREVPDPKAAEEESRATTMKAPSRRVASIPIGQSGDGEEEDDTRGAESRRWESAEEMTVGGGRSVRRIEGRWGQGVGKQEG